MPVFIFLHGNASSKLEGENYAGTYLPLGINVLSFDFNGCGNSDGDLITFGWKEKEDLQTVVNYLESLGNVSKIGIFGRSMGAATAILYCDIIGNDLVKCLVLDSGYSSV
jgi:pimeloyl-ACP methyl ester carboxylesterase